MALFGYNMRAADNKHCRHCAEPMPEYTLLCPNCILTKNPIDILEDMQQIVETANITDIKTFDKIKFRECEATFWTLHAVATASFGREEKVIEAVIILENMLYDIIDQREINARKNRRCIVKFVLLFFLSILLALVLLSIIGIITL